MTPCPRCQRDIPDDVTSCPLCGTSVDIPLPEDATRRLETPKSRERTQRALSYQSLDDARFVPGTMLTERYRIVGLLGKGGMGEVYRADDLKLGQAVALKFLPDRLLSDGASLARFHREVRIARQVSHKNVCRVYDIGEVNGHHFLSMEYIKGEELSSLLRRIGRLPADKAIQISRQLCAGLAAAHESGVLHRDLKPANVMIDGDGNVRILDFGLAGLAEEFREGDRFAGTPAYMAPEQLDGSAVTVRSDIYSLGLVLYELFTGKKAFEAPSLSELIKLRRSETTPSTPSSIIKDLDPLIEKVIDRCLQRDSAQRPASALQVAAALPGGDPIAVALAAGETPSPEMVAAAPKKGTLRPAIALNLLVAVVVLLALTMTLSKQLTVHRLMPLEKPPEVLKEHASGIIKSLGYTSAADVAYSFDRDWDYYTYLSDHRTSLDPWEALKQAQPAVIRFWYRQSPTVLVPYNTQLIDRRDPPNRVPGMVSIMVDTEGQLSYLEAVPPQAEVQGPQSNDQSAMAGGTSIDTSLQSDPGSPSSQTAVATPVVEWSKLFTAAGLKITDFQPTKSLWTPPHAYDERQAWAGVFPKLPQVPIRIEAASYRGRPVYFEIVSPWSRPADILRSQTAGQQASTWLLLGIFFSIMFVSALLALKNLRAGRGDRRGAFRVALFLFVIRLIHWLFSTHHVATSEELILLITGLQSALFWSCFVGLLYLALEPYLRRHWPQRIISWNRLLAGDLRDPLVGRDLLVGAVFGSFAIFMMHLRLAVPKWLGLYPGRPDVSAGFEWGLGIGSFVRMFLDQISASVAQGFMMVFLLLFLSLLFRRDWVGTAVGSLVLVTLFISQEIGHISVLTLVLNALATGALIVCVVRFGPLALMSAMAFFHLWVFFPITTDLTAWYATTFILDLIFLLALAGYGYFVSLRGQSPFNVKLLAD